jgi:hypothetical protein
MLGSWKENKKNEKLFFVIYIKTSVKVVIKFTVKSILAGMNKFLFFLNSIS